MDNFKLFGSSGVESYIFCIKAVYEILDNLKTTPTEKGGYLF